MNNTVAIIGKENQYEYRCGICSVTAYGHRGRCVCDDCLALEPKLENILAREYYRALNVSLRSYGEIDTAIPPGVAMAAMRLAYKAGWDAQCDVVSACLV